MIVTLVLYHKGRMVPSIVWYTSDSIPDFDQITAMLQSSYAVQAVTIVESRQLYAYLTAKEQSNGKQKQRKHRSQRRSRR